MNALLRKEVRLLLPSFAAALLLSFSLWLMPRGMPVNSGFNQFLLLLTVIACPVAALSMALDSFGREISSGTFPFLLAQPISRTRLWWTKTLLLAAALLVVLLSWAFSFHFCVLGEIMRSDPTAWKWGPHVTAAMVALVMFSGALWTVLFFRQVAAAFWFTLIIPGAILLAFINLMEHAPVLGRNLLLLTLGLYSLVGFLWARRLFLNAQDIARTGGEITMPRWRGLGRTNDRRQGRPRAALWRKELQLHQSQFVLAGVLLLLHLAVLFVRYVNELRDSPIIHALVHMFWVLWMFMPLVVGCTAVAEERKLGTLEGQLCLPATRRRQFIVKFASTLLLSVLFGAVLPMLLDKRIIFPIFDPHFGESSSSYPDGNYTQFGQVLGGILSVIVPFLGLAGLAALIGLVSFYASTLSRNTLQSLAPAVLGLLLVMLLWKVAANTEEVFGLRLWSGPLIYLLGVPAFSIALGGLMYWNFKRVLVGGMVWRRNLLVLLATSLVVTTATAGLYHRAWEFLFTMEPAHGPPVLTMDPRVKLRVEGWKPLVELPDGRTWASHGGRWTKNSGIIMGAGEFNGEFLEGTNWVKAVGTYRDLVALRRDGSLWVTEQSQQIPAAPHSAPARTRLMRVGTDHDWTNVVPYQFAMALLLKSDGTLWQFGTNRWSTNQPFPGLRAFTPERLGTNTDWADFSMQGGRILFHQRDGGLWVSPKYSKADTNTLALNAAVTLFRAPDLELTEQSVVQVAWKRGPLQVAVLPDGTFRAVGSWRSLTNRYGRQSWGMGKSNTRIGSETNWLALAARDHGIAVTLKGDGTLWSWEFPDDPALRPDTASAKQIGSHSDWIAVSVGWGGLFSLARDGSLWLWQFESIHWDWDRHTLLRPSRRPQRLGNIFETAER